ncbi:MAG: hypothetical protein WCY72_09855, partial [Lysobacteraceae bacterium]
GRKMSGLLWEPGSTLPVPGMGECAKYGASPQNGCEHRAKQPNPAENRAKRSAILAHCLRWCLAAAGFRVA